MLCSRVIDEQCPTAITCACAGWDLRSKECGQACGSDSERHKVNELACHVKEGHATLGGQPRVVWTLPDSLSGSNAPDPLPRPPKHHTARMLTRDAQPAERCKLCHQGRPPGSTPALLPAQQCSFTHAQTGAGPLMRDSTDSLLQDSRSST